MGWARPELRHLEPLSLSSLVVAYLVATLSLPATRTAVGLPRNLQWWTALRQWWFAHSPLETPNRREKKYTPKVFSALKTQVPQQAEKGFCVHQKACFQGKRMENTYTPKVPKPWQGQHFVLPENRGRIFRRH